MLLCPCPKLTPLQSRFLASVAALAILGLIYWSLSDAHFAYAAELEFDGSGQSRIRTGEDHNWHRIGLDALEWDEGDNEEIGIDPTPVLAARAATTSTIGGNNNANIDNIQPGDTTVWLFPQSQLMGRHAEVGLGLPSDPEEDDDAVLEHVDLRKRDSDTDLPESHGLGTRQSQNARRIFVSINTCVQPSYVGSGVQSAAPPQLTLYVATSSDNTNPGPDGDPSKQEAVRLDQGFANFSTIAQGNWHMSVHAPDLPSAFTNVWNYELAVSIDQYYHSLGTNGSNLFLIDSDSTAALLVTDNLTQANAGSELYQEWLSLAPPYIVFASNVNHTATMGIEKSYCGLSKNSQIVGNQADSTGDSTNVQMEMITRGLGNKPKEQFYVTFLNGSSNYHAILAQPGNSTNVGNGIVGGGGKVWHEMSFRTKSDGNCALLYNLDFCDQVAYAVPSSPNATANFTQFQAFYDDYTRNFYHNFNYSLQQIPCHTDSAAQYSLVKNCSDCAGAYKEWLCAVSIPRCEDFTNDASYLQIRNVGQAFLNGSSLSSQYVNRNYVPMSDAPTLEGSLAFEQTLLSSVATNQSRNGEIDKHIAPGPYKEVLPCEDLCYSLVQSCPAALGFGCPYPGRGLEVGYGTRAGLKNGTLTCSYLGAYVYTDDSSGLNVNALRALAFAGMAALLVMTGS